MGKALEGLYDKDGVFIEEKPFPQATHDWYKTNGLDHATYNHEPSMARQEFAAECDINTIMDRYQSTGFLPQSPFTPAPTYVDFTEIPQDLMGTLQFLADAEKAFMQLPAQVRRTFDNNPHEFVAYASDPANLDQLRAWELAPKPAPEPPAMPVAPAPESPPVASPQPAK